MTSDSLKKHLWLTALFLLSLPVFCWLQWQPDVWFKDQLAINALSGKISYASVEKSFPGVRLSNVIITLPDGKNIACDTLLLRPALLSMLGGSQALHVRADTADIKAEAVLAQLDGRIVLDDVALNADASAFSRYDSRLMLLGLQGTITVQGHAIVQAANGLPVDGDITLEWNKPSSILLPVQIDTIHVSLKPSDAEGGNIWEWQFSSQPQELMGHGKIVAGGPDIQTWLLRGNLKLAKDQPELVLSGTLGAPHWQ